MNAQPFGNFPLFLFRGASLKSDKKCKFIQHFLPDFRSFLVEILRVALTPFCRQIHQRARILRVVWMTTLPYKGCVTPGSRRTLKWSWAECSLPPWDNFLSHFSFLFLFHLPVCSSLLCASKYKNARLLVRLSVTKIPDVQRGMKDDGPSVRSKYRQFGHYGQCKQCNHCKQLVQFGKMFAILSLAAGPKCTNRLASSILPFRCLDR